MADRPIQVIVADDHPVIRMGMEAVLDQSPTHALVGSAANSDELLALLHAHPCDVVVTDYAMPGGEHGDGLALIALLRRTWPALRIVVVTGLDQPAMIREIHAAGIDHIVSKSDDHRLIGDAVQAAYVNRRYFSPSVLPLIPARGSQRGSPALSPREREVVALLATGLTVNEVAERLGRRKQTISTQKVNAMAKLAIERDADLYKYVLEHGLDDGAGD